MKAKHRFKEGDFVASTSQLSKMLVVSKVVYRSIDEPTGRRDDDGNAICEQRKKLEGIMCQWEEEGIPKENIFHSRLLVPYEVAKDGIEKVQEWIEANR